MYVYVQDSVADLMETVDKKPATAANRSATVCRHGQRGLETLEGILSNLPTGQVCFTNIYTGWRKGPACITMLAFKYSAAKMCVWQPRILQVVVRSVMFITGTLQL